MERVLNILQIASFILGFNLNIFFTLSCSSENMSGSQRVDPGKRKITATCTESQLISQETREVKGLNNVKLAIEGQICLSGETPSSDSMNVMFIVDRSASMADADPNCARKSAISSVINKILQQSSGSTIYGSLVTFAGGAKSYSWTSLASLSYGSACGHESRYEISGATNYEAAFNTARSLFSSKSGDNVIFFITDGAPSHCSKCFGDRNDFTNGAYYGRIAMNNLKSSVNNLTVNAVYLVDPGLNPYKGEPTAQETQNYLIDLVGDASRVVRAARASDLVGAISNFETTPAGTFSSAKDLTATVRVGNSTKKVGIEKLTYESEGVYTYKLKEVALQGTSGKVVDNIFTVTGQGSNGQTSTSKIIVKFTRTN